MASAWRFDCTRLEETARLTARRLSTVYCTREASRRRGTSSLAGSESRRDFRATQSRKRRTLRASERDSSARCVAPTPATINIGATCLRARARSLRWKVDTGKIFDSFNVAQLGTLEKAETRVQARALCGATRVIFQAWRSLRIIIAHRFRAAGTTKMMDETIGSMFLHENLVRVPCC